MFTDFTVTGSTSAEETERIVQVIDGRLSIAMWCRDLWRFRGVLAALCVRDIRSKYKQAVLGIAWAVIQPTVQVAIYSLVFKGIAKIDTPLPYPVFVLASLLPFNLFQQIVSFGTPAFVSSQGIVTKVYFPRLYTVIAGSASAFVNASISFVLLVVLMAVFGVRMSWSIALTLPVLLVVALFAVGTGAALSALNARFRDVQHALPLLMTLLMYVSPVLYPLDAVPRTFRIVASFNPVSGLVDAFRSAIGGTVPASWELVGFGMLASLVVFVIGIAIFESSQARLIDVL